MKGPRSDDAPATATAGGTAPSAPQPVETTAAPQTREDQRERFTPQAPTVNPDPVFVALPEADCCGNCPGWKQQHPKYPFGQCLPAIRVLGAPMYTPHLSGCMLDPELKARAGR